MSVDHVYCKFNGDIRFFENVVVAPIPATPYLDEHYRTKMIWWDRRTMVNHSQPEQITKALREIDAISAMLVAR